MKENHNYFDAVDNEVRRGMEGLNVGIPFGVGLEAINDFLHGIKRSFYTLLGGNTGTGKTALADQMYVLGPLEFLMKNPDFKFQLHIDYYTLEISIVRKLTKWTCWKIYHEKGILLDSDTLLSKSMKHRLSEEIYQEFLATREWIENLQQFITFREHASPQTIRTNTVNFFSTKGETVDKYIMQEGILTKIPVFVHNNPNLIFQSIVDHIGLMKKDTGITDKKANLDTHSANVVANRNFYGISHLDISQFNRDIGDINRKRFSELSPQLEDFKDSGNTQEDADAVLAIFEPKRYNLSDYKEYQLKYLSNFFRVLFVLKNRDGGAGSFKALCFRGECGAFDEFPRIQAFKDNPSLYEETFNKLNNVRRGH